MSRTSKAKPGSDIDYAKSGSLAKNPGPGICVHCLKFSAERDWDHVFPESWYPETSPTDLYKWQVLSCIACNRELGRIEEEFLRLVALCLDPDNNASRGIVEKALRSLNPLAGRSPRDQGIRATLRQRVLDDVREGSDIPRVGIFPGMGERWGRPLKDRVAVLIPAESFHRITEKIVRGIFFIEDKKLVEPPFAIQFFALDPETGSAMREALDRFGVTYSREPGVIVRRAVVPEDGLSSMFEIEFWKRFKTYATVTSEK